ncbi:recombination regulator RecX [Nonomuraea terrae]|uniref:Regulatory protein RecX n=1 Tax=Nonomuraea terrae TaxID=2530383 RepID=A0A4R4YL83_9ACTN|nr:recombination regulator RecX [Nonomuraea terrae]TDD44829.1 recombination regulator RecX [Nonomuraea terrae]
MSNTDRPQAPHLPDRGVRLPSSGSSGGRDLARSSADGWPSVDEWREQRLRLRAEEPSTAPYEAGGPGPVSETGDSGSVSEAGSPGPVSGVDDSGSVFERDGSRPVSAAEEPKAVSDVETAPSAPIGGEAAIGSAERAPDEGRTDVRPGSEWHAEVLAGSSWFAAGQSEQGIDRGGDETERASGGRRSGGSGRRSGRAGGKRAGQRPRGRDRSFGEDTDAGSPPGWAPSGDHPPGWASGSDRLTGSAPDGDRPVGWASNGDRSADWDSDRLTGSAPDGDRPAGWASDGDHSTGVEAEWGSRGGAGGESDARGRSRGGKRRKGGRAGDQAGAGAGHMAEGRTGKGRSGSAAEADPEAVARNICLRLLTMAPKTRAQLAEALRKRDVPEEAAEAVLSRFSELGLINDEAFAAAWVDSRHHGRGLAKRALAAELRHRGVDSETVSEAVERLDPDQEAETARRLVERKLSATRSLDPKTRTRRLAGMLARKGYSSGLAFRVIREALEQEGIDMEEDLP